MKNGTEDACQGAGSAGAEPAKKRSGSSILYLLTLLCMTVFALNSIFCRAALSDSVLAGGGMGPLLYSSVRCLSAALILVLLCTLGIIQAGQKPGGADAQGRKKSVWQEAWAQSTWRGAVFLYAYMFCFSLAYVEIESAPGTLILNMCVQFAMVGFGMLHGLYPGRREYLGLGVAAIGLVALLSPGLAAPSPVGAALMAAAGFAWGAYSLCGRSVLDAAAATAGHFWRASLFALASLFFALIYETAPQCLAVLFALAGGLASSLGYILWYALVPRYSLTGSAVVQLSVPVLTALLGACFLSEAVTLRLVVCSVLVLGGILLALMSRKHG